MNGRTLMEDHEKFKRGMEIFLKRPDFSVGMTPSEVVYTEDKMKVLHYIPTVEKPHPVPILIVYALVNRYYILDLQPDKSVIKKLLEEGFDVYQNLPPAVSLSHFYRAGDQGYSTCSQAHTQ